MDRVVLEASVLFQPMAAGASGTDRPAVPERILILPWGEVRSAAGNFIVDAESLKATVEAFEAHGTDLPIDYEHQTLGGAYSSPTGQAPAAGWIRALKRVTPASGDTDEGGAPVAPGLWAEVSWTDEGRARLANRQYRYLSPVALVRRSDRRLVGLHSVALTNKPAIVGMPPVVNRRGEAGAATGDPDTDESSDMLALSALRAALELDDSVEDAAVLAMAERRIRALEAAAAARGASDRVADAMSAGKLTPAQRDWALALALRDPEEFDRWSAAAPQVVVPGRTAAPNERPSPAGSNRRAIETAARAEWHANRPFLEALCTEAAYVAHALREGGA